MLLPEFNTHRVFSRNARSSRAVPVKTMLNEVRTKPFVPWQWGKNQKGMQASEECNEVVNPMPFVTNAAYDPYALPYDMTREEAWRNAANHAVAAAEAYMTAGYHKQIANRLLEPFMWIDVLVTATEWSNFLWLRDHGDAEPHLRDLARLVGQAIEAAYVQELEPGEWHLPYITDADRKEAYNGPSQSISWNWLCRLSAARCARISYKPFDGDASYERELERYDSLVKSDRVHASPLEHPASPDRMSPEGRWENPHLSGNFAPGWVQYRKTVPGENHV